MIVPVDLPGPFGGSRAWHGSDLAADGSWVHDLSAGEIAELEAASRDVEQRGLPMGRLTRADFPLPTLARAVDAWADELDAGRGVVLVRGLPVARYTPDQVAILYYGLGLHLGVPVSQNTDGDLLGHVRDVGADPNDLAVRLYKTRAAQPFHTDGSDVVGLLCLHPARAGGESTIVSSTAVYDELLARRPDLAHLLFAPWCFDLYEQQAPGDQGWFEAPIARVVGARLYTFYLRFYIEKAQRHPEVPRLTREQRDLLDTLDALCAELRFEMDFAPGDIQWLSNATIFHGRAEYVDHDDPARRRHLLRLWLTLHRNAVGGAGFLGVEAADQ